MKKNLTAEEKAAERQRRKREREISDIKAIVLTPEGRRFYRRLLASCQLYHETYHTDGNQAFIEKGRRLVGTEFMFDLMEADQGAFVQMNREYNSELKSEENIEEQERKEDPGILAS